MAPEKGPRHQGPRLRPLSPAEANQPKPGSLLIGPPPVRDPNFRRSVVLLCDHSDEGSFGLVLNRPLSLTLGEVLKSTRGSTLPVSLGGPVQTDTLHFLHRFGDLVPGTVRVFDDVYWGGDFDMLQVLIESGQSSPEELRFFLGYSGWSTGQLGDEIARGGWLMARSDVATVFPTDHDHLWRDTLRRMGGDYALLSTFPEDPRMN